MRAGNVTPSILKQNAPNREMKRPRRGIPAANATEILFLLNSIENFIQVTYKLKGSQLFSANTRKSVCASTV